MVRKKPIPALAVFAALSLSVVHGSRSAADQQSKSTGMVTLTAWAWANDASPREGPVTIEPDYVAGYRIKAQGSGMMGQGAYVTLDYYFHLYHDSAAGQSEDRSFYQVQLGELRSWVYEPPLNYEASLSPGTHGIHACSWVQLAGNQNSRATAAHDSTFEVE